MNKSSKIYWFKLFPSLKVYNIPGSIFLTKLLKFRPHYGQITFWHHGKKIVVWLSRFSIYRPPKSLKTMSSESLFFFSQSLLKILFSSTTSFNRVPCAKKIVFSQLNEFSHRKKMFHILDEQEIFFLLSVRWSVSWSLKSVWYGWIFVKSISGYFSFHLKCPLRRRKNIFHWKFLFFH